VLRSLAEETGAHFCSGTKSFGRESWQLRMALSSPSPIEAAGVLSIEELIKLKRLQGMRDSEGCQKARMCGLKGTEK
jgi:hypothetical protein